METQKLTGKCLSSISSFTNIALVQVSASLSPSDRQYALITDFIFGNDNTADGLGAILMQTYEEGRFNVIAYASRNLQKYEKNYTPFLLEMQAAIFGMETFEVHLRGRHFRLYTDHKPLEKLAHQNA
jgi:RNase H-like domain found in reverse transcriptase